jgi:hypothetical protein
VAKVYKVSYVVLGGKHPGGITNTDSEPKAGDQVTLDKIRYTVVEVIPLVPPRGDFNYLHVTLKPVEG